MNFVITDDRVPLKSDVYNAPVENAKLYSYSINDLVEQLNVTRQEAEFLLQLGNFKFWFTGEDHLKAEKKWTYDGDASWSDFSFREFLLANIVAGYYGAVVLGFRETADKIKAMKSLRKYIFFGQTRVILKSTELTYVFPYIERKDS